MTVLNMTGVDPNIAAIRAHLERLTRRWHEIGADAWISLEIRLLARESSPLVLKYRPDADGLQMAAEDIAHWNAKGRNAYACVNPLKENVGGPASDGDIAAAFHCFADCDDQAAGDALKAFVGPKYTHVVLTGTKPHARPHPYWELAEPQTDLDAWSDMQRRIAAALGSDRVVINPSRIMRIAGTVTWPNQKKQDRGYVSELVTFIDKGTPPVEWSSLDRAFAHAAPQAAHTPLSAFAGIDTGPKPLDRQTVTTAALSGEEWHNNIIRLVGSYVSKGLTDAEIHAITDGMTLAGYTVDETRREVQTAINGARAKGWTPEPKATAFDYPAQPDMSVSLDGNITESIWMTCTRNADLSTAEGRAEFDGRLRSALYNINDIGLRAHVGAILKEKRAAALKSGSVEQTWRIQSTAEFTADFTAPEYVVEGILQRGRMYTLTAPTGHGKTAATIYMATHIAAGAHICGQETEKGSVIFLAGENPDDVRARAIAAMEAYEFDAATLDLHWIAGTFSIRMDMQRLLAAIERLPNTIAIVVDTFAAYFDGDNENDNAQALDFARMLRTLTQAASKPLVIMPAHPIKNATRSTLVPKGGSSLLNEVDGNLTIWNDDNLLTMHWQGKHRGPDFEPLTMELQKYETAAIHDKHGRLMPTVVARPVMQLRAMELAGKTIDKETAVLQSIDTRPDLPVRERAVECGLSRSAMDRTIKRLLERKWLRRKGRKLALTDQGEEAMNDGLQGVSEEI